MMVLAVTLHNIPEGMALGVVYAGLLSSGGTQITAAGALALSLGIAISCISEAICWTRPKSSVAVPFQPSLPIT